MRTRYVISALSLLWPASTASAPEPRVNWTVPRILSIEERIVRESSLAGISAHLPLAIVWGESCFRSMLVGGPNRDGSYDFGLFQLNSRTVRVLHVSNPLDPTQNIIAGVGLTAAYKRLCGSDTSARYAYAHGRCPERP